MKRTIRARKRTKTRVRTKKKDPIYVDGERPRPMYVDYKDVELLKKLINRHGRIVGRRKTGCSAASQHAVTQGDQARPLHGSLAVHRRVATSETRQACRWVTRRRLVFALLVRHRWIANTSAGAWKNGCCLLTGAGSSFATPTPPASCISPPSSTAWKRRNTNCSAAWAPASTRPLDPTTPHAASSAGRGWPPNASTSIPPVSRTCWKSNCAWQRIGTSSVTYAFQFRVGDRPVAHGALTAVYCRFLPGRAPESVPIDEPLRGQLAAYQLA